MNFVNALVKTRLHSLNYIRARTLFRFYTDWWIKRMLNLVAISIRPLFDDTMTMSMGGFFSPRLNVYDFKFNSCASKITYAWRIFAFARLFFFENYRKGEYMDDGSFINARTREKQHHRFNSKQTVTTFRWNKKPRAHT